MLILSLFACFEPSETGASGFAGRILDHSGAPIVGLQVQTEEARKETDAQGHVAINWKIPRQQIDFRVGTVLWQRSRGAGDDGKVLDVTVPEGKSGKLTCATKTPCTATVTWRPTDTLIGRVVAKCAEGVSFDVEGIPQGPVEVTCQGEPTEKVRVLELADQDGGWVIREPRYPVFATVRSTDRAPAQCAVFFGNIEGTVDENKRWTATIDEVTPVRAVCDGRVSQPQWVRPGAPEVALDWSPTGPDLDLGQWSPGVGAVRIDSLEDPRLSLPVPAGADGRFHFPPLPAGRYRIGNSPDPASPVPDGLRSGALYLSRQGDPVDGFLILDADLVEGAIRVEPQLP